MKIIFALGLGLTAFFTAIPFKAFGLIYQGDTTNQPTWLRTIVGNPPDQLSGQIPGEAAVIVPYNVYQFAVVESGFYTFGSTVPGATSAIDGAWDNFLALYQGSFAPTAQLTNILVAANAPNNGSPAFNQQLTSGQNYFLVTTGRRPNDFGAFNNTITLESYNNSSTTSAFSYEGNTTGGSIWYHVAPGAPPQIVSASLVPYRVLIFTVDRSGLYDFTSAVPNAKSAVDGSWDNFLALYQDDFNPAAPLDNALAAANAPNNGSLAFSTELTTGKNYFLVTSGRQAGDFGAFTNTINGAGKVTAVPEPNSISVTLTAVSIGLLLSKRRRGGITEHPTY